MMSRHLERSWGHPSPIVVDLMLPELRAMEIYKGGLAATLVGQRAQLSFGDSEDFGQAPTDGSDRRGEVAAPCEGDASQF
jgi:hypothetical protein